MFPAFDGARFAQTPISTAIVGFFAPNNPIDGVMQPN